MSDKRIPEINNEPLLNDTYNAVSSKHNKRDFKMKGKSKEFIAHNPKECIKINCRICKAKTGK